MEIVFLLFFLGAPFAQSQPLFTVGPRFGIPNFLPGINSTSADFNLDGIPDVFLGNAFTLPIAPHDRLGYVQLLNSDGSSRATLTAGSTPWLNHPLLATAKSAASEDVNADGWPDLIVVTGQGNIVVAINSGQADATAGFLSVNSVGNISPLLPPTSMVIGGLELKLADVNGDGNPDILVWGSYSWDQGYPVPTTTLLGNGNGTFSAPIFVPQSQLGPQSATADVEWVDLDGDGAPDTLVALKETLNPSSYSQQVHLESFTWTPGAGGQAGAWVPGQAVMVFVTGKPTALEYGDVNGDGSPDFLISAANLHANGRPNGDIYVLYGSAGNPLNVSPFGTAMGGLQSTENEVIGLRVLDINKDGLKDIVAVNARGSALNADIVYVLNNGSGTLTQPQLVDLGAKVACPHGGLTQNWNYPSRPSPQALTVADFGSDGAPDFIVNNLMASLGGINTLGRAVVMNTTPLAAGQGPFFEHIETGRVNRSGRALDTGFSGGAPVVGNSNFAIVLNDVPGDGTVVGLNAADFWIPPIPYGPSLGALSVDVYPVNSSSLWMMNHTGPSGGFVSYPLPIPSNPSLAGYEAWFQFVYADPLSPEAFPVFDSRAAHLRIGM